METKTKFGALVILFLGVIVVLALLPTIADRTKELSEKVITTNETLNVTANECYSVAGAKGQVQTNDTRCNITVTHAPTANSWDMRNCPISAVVIGNASGDALTLTTDYTVNASRGVISLVNSTGVNASVFDTAYMTYTWCDEGYIAQGAGRTVAQLVLIFSAIGLLAWAIYTGIKEWL